MEQIGDLIDKLSIINIKIWDATGKAHATKEIGKASELFRKIEIMNNQRKEYINAINAFFDKKQNALNNKTIR